MHLVLILIAENAPNYETYCTSILSIKYHLRNISNLEMDTRELILSIETLARL
jgi:hypothetical protein